MTIRFNQALAAAVAVFLFPSIAAAIGISIVGVSGPGESGVLGENETVTFDLVMENDSTEEIFGLEVNISGYDEPDIFARYDSGVRLQGGRVVDAAFGTFDPMFGIRGSVDNILDEPEENWEVNNIRPEAFTTRLFAGVGLAPSVGTGEDDLGIDGDFIRNGDIHFQVTFVNIRTAGQSSTESIVMDFDVLAVGRGGVILPTTGDSFALTAIPEPGTALLIGAGLVVLANRRPRRPSTDRVGLSAGSV